MAGPLVQVNTIVAGVTLDVSRILNLGPDVVLRLVVADTTQFDNLRTVLTVTSGWDRMQQVEQGLKDGNKVVFKIADVDGTVRPIINTKDLMIDVDNELFDIASVPLINPNSAQVYTLNCRTRNLRRRSFDQTK